MKKKFALYEKAGIQEYRLIEPKYQTVPIFRLENEKCILHSYIDAENTQIIVQPHLLKGFEVSKKEIFT